MFFQNCLVWNAKEHKCEEFEPAKNGTVNWQLVPVYDNFNARDWFQPKKYANDVVDVETIMEGKRRFFLGSEWGSHKLLDSIRNKVM